MKPIRSLKEGPEIRPVGHWNGNSINVPFSITSLTDFIINLTQFFRSDNHRENTQKSENQEDHEKERPQKNDDKFDIYFEEKGKNGIVNVKLLRKYLLPCAKTLVYQKLTSDFT